MRTAPENVSCALVRVGVCSAAAWCSVVSTRSSCFIQVLKSAISLVTLLSCSVLYCQGALVSAAATGELPISSFNFCFTYFGLFLGAYMSEAVTSFQWVYSFRLRKRPFLCLETNFPLKCTMMLISPVQLSWFLVHGVIYSLLLSICLFLCIERVSPVNIEVSCYCLLLCV